MAGGGFGMLLQSPEGLLIEKAVKFLFLTLNSKVEYEVVLLRLRVARALLIVKLELRYDSQLVALQIQGECKAKNDLMALYILV